MPVAAIVTWAIETVAAPFVASAIAPAVASVVGTGATAAAVTQVTALALSGAGAGAVVAAATGQDVGQAALTNALTAGVSAGAAPLAGQITQTALGEAAKDVIVGSTTVGDVVSGAITKAAGGAASAAAQGGDILKAAEMGAVSGAAAPLVMGGIEAVTGSGQPTYTDPTTGQTSIAQGPPSTPSLTGNKYIDAAILGGRTQNIMGNRKEGFLSAGDTIYGATTPLLANTLGGVATGLAPETAFKRAIPSAIGGAISGEALYGLGLEPATASTLGSFSERLAQTYLPSTMIDRPSPSYPTYQAPPQAPSQTPSTAPGGLSGTGPSPTLGQSLSIAPTLGYSPGMTVFGSGGEGDRPKQRVWNVASLRNIGESEA